MTHRLSATTRSVAAATAATALLAVVEVAETVESLWMVPAALLLGAAVIVMLRLTEAGVEVHEDVVVVRNVTRVTTLDRADVVGFEAGTWNSRVVLADGRIVLSLLREKDVAGQLDLSQTHVVLDAPAATPVPVGV